MATGRLGLIEELSDSFGCIRSVYQQAHFPLVCLLSKQQIAFLINATFKHFCFCWAAATCLVLYSRLNLTTAH